MRHFLYFENGGPFPGTCISCGYNKELFDIGGTRIDGGSNLVCIRCIGELAEFIGFAPKKPLLDEITALETTIFFKDKELAKIPNLVDGLINGIRSSVADFIFAVSHGGDADVPPPVQNDAGAGEGADQAGETAPRQRKAPSKPASH